jgi:RimJ/RimL family protein N-acetyltransferase
MEIKFQEIIIGNHIILRKLELDDAQEVFLWRSGISGQYLRQPEGYNEKAQSDWIKSRGVNEINYIIHDKRTNLKVGTIGIYDVNNADKVANVGRLLLSDEYLGKSNPYGLEALLLCYDYVFNELGFRKITGDILAKNEAVFKLQIFLGMKQEGFLEKHVIIHGITEDIHIMSIFKNEFINTYKRKIKFLLNSFR